MRHQEADSPVGKQLTTAYRDEAGYFERDGKDTSARRLRALADRMDSMAHKLGGRVQHGPEGTAAGGAG